MSEATSYRCAFQEVASIEDTPKEFSIVITDPCGRPADHRLVLEIEGAGRRQQFLCCEHKEQTLRDLALMEFCGVTVITDEPLRKATVSAQVFWSNPEDCFIYIVTIREEGAPYATVMPAVKLAAVTWEDAAREADEKVAALQRLADGE